MLNKVLPQKEIILKELNEIPENLFDEVLDFIRFLKLKSVKENSNECYLLSESSLAKDWLDAEEDEAWKDL